MLVTGDYDDADDFCDDFYIFWKNIVFPRLFVVSSSLLNRMFVQNRAGISVYIIFM